MISIIIALLVIAVVAYIVNQIPMAPFMRNILNAVIALVVVLWLLGQFGYGPGIKF